MMEFADIYSPLPPSTREVVMEPDTEQRSEHDIRQFIRSVFEKNKPPEDWEDHLRRPFPMVSGVRKRRLKRAKRSRLSLKERRELGLYKLRKSSMKYADLLPLHNLWKEYFLDYINFGTLEKERGILHSSKISHKLMKADYHGALFTVKKSVCCSLVGKKGIVVFDTKNTFQLLGEDDVLRIIPKESSVFTLMLQGFTFTILGNQFCFKPSARNAKKMKNCISLKL